FTRSALGVIIGRPEAAQSDGTVGTDASPMIWIGMPGASWPAMRMSALRTAPHVKPVPNTLHSPLMLLVLPAGGTVATAGSTTLAGNCEARMRRPCEPVSTWMLSIVTQLDVPGAQTVTLVVSMLRVCVGVDVTTTG